MKESSVAASRITSTRSRFPLWLQWTLATTLGYAVGMSFSTSVVGAIVRPLGPVLDGMLNVLIYGAVIGLPIGLAELAVLPRRVSPPVWLLANLLGGSVGFAAAALAGEALGRLIEPGKTNVAGEAAVALIAGALIGLALGIAQWFALNRSINSMRHGNAVMSSEARPSRDIFWWLAASIGGTVIGSMIAATLLGLFEIPILSDAPAPTVGVIAGLCTGFLQGLVLSSRVHD